MPAFYCHVHARWSWCLGVFPEFRKRARAGSLGLNNRCGQSWWPQILQTSISPFAPYYSTTYLPPGARRRFSSSSRGLKPRPLIVSFWRPTALPSSLFGPNVLTFSIMRSTYWSLNISLFRSLVFSGALRKSDLSRCRLNYWVWDGGTQEMANPTYPWVSFRCRDHKSL